MLRHYTPARARFAAFCWGVGALACTDLGPPGQLSAGVGGQSGDGSGFQGGQTGDGGGFAKIGAVQCAHKSTAWKGELDDVVPGLGITPDDVIASVEAGAEETLGWVANERLKLGGGKTEVLVDLHYGEGEMRLREPAPVPEVAIRNDVADLAPPASYVSRASQYCGTVLEIDVEARLSTADGALDEKFTVKVTANTQGSAHLEGWLPEKLDGALGDSLLKQDTRLYVASIVTPWGSSGEVMAIPINQPTGEPPAPAEQVAVWPLLDAAVCADPGFGTLSTNSVPVKAGGTLEDRFDALAPRGDLPLRWNKAPAGPDACSEQTSSEQQCNTTLHVELGTAPKTWCVSVTPFDASFTAYGRIGVDLRTADERWIGQYTSAATLSIQADGTASAALAITQHGVGASGVELGFPHLELAVDSEATLNADLITDSSGTFGYLSVMGVLSLASGQDAGAPEIRAPEVLINAGVGPQRSE